MRRFLRSKELNISRRKITYTFVALVVLAVAIWVLPHRTTAEPDVPVVATVPVAQEDVNIYGEYVGRIRAQQFVEIRERVEGFLEEMLFDDLTYVAKIHVLFVINQEQYRAKADKARAQLKKDEAQERKAQRDLERIRPLYAQNAASQLDLDNAVAAYESAVASVAQYSLTSFMS